jgi:hypothetical protein
LLFALGVVDPLNAIMIILNVGKFKPRLPPSVAFQLLFMIENVAIHQCIIDEGESTCVMYAKVLNKLGSLELVPSMITLYAYDGRPSQIEGLYHNIPIELAKKQVLIDIKVVNIPLDYNILLGCSYIYAMKVVSFSILCTTKLPQEGKAITIYHLTSHDPKSQLNPNNVFPFVNRNQTVSSFFDVCPRIFKDSILLDMHYSPSLLLTPLASSNVCAVTTSQQPLLSQHLPHMRLHPCNHPLSPMSSTPSRGGNIAHRYPFT